MHKVASAEAAGEIEIPEGGAGSLAHWEEQDSALRAQETRLRAELARRQAEDAGRRSNNTAAAPAARRQRPQSVTHTRRAQPPFQVKRCPLRVNPV